MKTITFAWLDKEGACEEALREFEARFGEKASVQEVVAALHQLQRGDWEAWLLTRHYKLTCSMIKHGADIHVNYDDALCPRGYFFLPVFTHNSDFMRLLLRYQGHRYRDGTGHGRQSDI